MALGKTKLHDNENIGALLSGGPMQVNNMSEKEEDEKLKHNKSAKFSDKEAERLEKIMVALGTDQVSKALRWCLEKTWETHGENIEEIAEKKKQIGSLQ